MSWLRKSQLFDLNVAMLDGALNFVDHNDISEEVKLWEKSEDLVTNCEDAACSNLQQEREADTEP